METSALIDTGSVHKELTAGDKKTSTLSAIRLKQWMRSLESDGAVKDLLGLDGCVDTSLWLQMWIGLLRELTCSHGMVINVAKGGTLTPQL